MLAAIVPAAFMALASSASAEKGCDWDKGKDNLICNPKAFEVGCVVVANDTCDDKGGCKTVYFNTEVIGNVGLLAGQSTTEGHVLKPGKKKDDMGQELKIAYGQRLVIKDCRFEERGKGGSCYKRIQRTFDENSGGAKGQCDNNCRDGGLGTKDCKPAHTGPASSG
jgi:hypothetical protein